MAGKIYPDPCQSQSGRSFIDLNYCFVSLCCDNLSEDHFIITFDDIKYIDWRYVDIKKKTGKLYQIVNLLGINMMPTVLVFLASIPAFLYIVNGNEFSLVNIIGFVVMIVIAAMFY